MLLISRPPLAAITSPHRASNTSTRSPIFSRLSSLESAVKLTMSANPTVRSVVWGSASIARIDSTRATAAARWRRQA